MLSDDNRTVVIQPLPTIATAWRMTFAELAPCIREGIKSGAATSALKPLIYLLTRKIARKPRIAKTRPPEKPHQKPRKSKWPNLDYKKQNAVLRAKSRRLFTLVDKLTDRNQRSNPSCWKSLHRTMVRSTVEERLHIEVFAYKALPEPDSLKFSDWLRENHEALLSYHESVLKYHEALKIHDAHEAKAKIAHGKTLQTWADLLGTKFTILRNIEREVGEYLAHTNKIVRMPFRIFPADSEGYMVLDTWLANQSRLIGGHEERLQRFEFARSLIPSKWGVGLDDYDGYVIFIFNWTKSVLIEKAQNRNAAYIIHQEWETLCRLTRRQLRTRPKQLWERVIHNNFWQWQRAIQMALQKGRE
ncbi:MAG: hypothetical protein ACO1TE_23240 [Prosthecobacter sp.]